MREKDNPSGGFPRRLTDRVTLLGNHYISSYLVEGSFSAALIEVGVSATARQVVEQIDQFDIGRDKIRFAVVTHAHADHLCGAPVLKSVMPKLEIVASAATEALTKKEKIMAAFAADDAYYRKQLLAAGAVAEPLFEAADLSGSVDRLIEPGQRIDLGDATLKVLDLPGHCPGGIGMWLEEEKFLFPSDSLGFLMPPDRLVTNYFVSFDDFLATFDRLTGLAPTWIGPGHTGPIDPERRDALLTFARKELEREFEWISAFLAEPGGREQAAHAVFEKQFVREAAELFSEETMRTCAELLVRRVATSMRHRGDD